MRFPSSLLVLSFSALACAADQPAEDKADLSIVHRIKSEAFQNSQVMDTLFYLSDANGPRVTGSKGFKSAAAWAVKRLEGYGLTNVKQEEWGIFGKSWDLEHYEGHMIEPQYSPLIGFPLAWTAGTNGKLQGEAMLAVMTTEADFERYRGKLRGKMVLTQAPRELTMSMTPLAHRLTGDELLARTMTPDPGARGGGPFGAPAAAANAGGGRGGRAGGRGGNAADPADPLAARRFRDRLNQFLKDEGVAVVVQTSATADGGTVFGSSGGGYKAKDMLPGPMVILTAEHYNRIARLLERSMPVKLEFDIRSTTGTADEPSINVVGEIPGTGKHKDEVVMIGGHLDSWHGGTGATDNGTGSSVAIEAMRVLKALNVPLDRTVRIGLWSGEEEGLLGSIAYVKNHFADRADMKLKPEYAKLSAYYNSDTGTGKFRGIGAGGNDLAVPIFEAWIKPFADLGITVVSGVSQASNRAPAGTDHTSFDYAGLPGFGFLQEPMEYNTRTHHSNMDTYDRVQRGDLMQSAALMAAFAYHTAVRSEMMPRTPTPKPTPWPANRQ